jgi:hypothetical protein
MSPHDILTDYSSGISASKAIALLHLGGYRDLLIAIPARDIQAHPDQMQQFSPELLARATALVEGIEVDLDAPIEGEVAI